MTAVDQLCPNCGLCCDGTLFADVELRAGDDAKRLKKLGLSLKKKKEDENEKEEEDDYVVKKGQRKIAFTQPCGCFDGILCKIYADRPKRCRLFECGLLKKVATGEMKAGAALEKISAAKGLATKVRRLLDSFGQSGNGAALSERYAQAMGEPVDLSDETGGAERHGKLMRAFDDLMRVLQRDFLR
jgi:uncharacterized protein